MIRYRFQSAADLERHLRLGHGVFFLPDLQAAGTPGERVVVEIVFPQADDSPMVHGKLLSVTHDGVWLEAPTARAAARWTPGPDSPRRRQKRVACELFVEVRTPEMDAWLCRALDLSESGVRLATGSFETGVAGDQVALTLLSEGEPLEVRARLCWAGSRAAGFELLTKVPRELLQTLVAAAQRPTVELGHSAECPCALPLAPAMGQRQP